MSGLSTRQRTTTRTRVNTSSITLNFDSFPFVPDLPAPGMRVFFCFGKARPQDEDKPEMENTLPLGGRLSVSPESRSGLTHRRLGLDSQERIHAKPGATRPEELLPIKRRIALQTALSKKDRRFTLLTLSRAKDPPRRIDSGAAQKSKRERRTRSPAGY